MQALKAQKRALRQEEAQLQDERRAVRQRRQLEDAAWQELRTARQAPTSTAAETAPPERTAQDDPWRILRRQRPNSWRRILSWIGHGSGHAWLSGNSGPGCQL